MIAIPLFNRLHKFTILNYSNWLTIVYRLLFDRYNTRVLQTFEKCFSLMRIDLSLIYFYSYPRLYPIRSKIQHTKQISLSQWRGFVFVFLHIYKVLRTNIRFETFYSIRLNSTNTIITDSQIYFLLFIFYFYLRFEDTFHKRKHLKKTNIYWKTLSYRKSGL